jgi:DtxR family transcriptional regulator, Mn-dependent transcriptional regulator
MQGSRDVSESLEDYLELVYTLSRDRGSARVGDLARARSVSMASASLAVKKLKRDGLVEAVSRDGIRLTEEGADLARQLSSRHEFLTRFLRDLLGVEPATAEKDACAIEHHLSPDTLSHLVAFAQFAGSRMCGGESISDAFRVSEPTGCITGPVHGRGRVRCRGDISGPNLAELEPGERCRIVHLHAECGVRQRLAALGLLPGTEVRLERRAPIGGPVQIALDHSMLSIRRRDAAAIEVERLD